MSGFSVGDLWLVESSAQCFSECLVAGNQFCRSIDSIHSGYCCDQDNCSAFGSEFSFCSNEALVSALNVHACPFQIDECKAKGTFRGETENLIQLSTSQEKELFTASEKLIEDEICYYEISGGVDS